MKRIPAVVKNVKKDFVENSKMKEGFFSVKEIIKKISDSNDKGKLDIIEYIYDYEGLFQKVWVDTLACWIEEIEELKKIMIEQVKKIFEKHNENLPMLYSKIENVEKVSLAHEVYGFCILKKEKGRWKRSDYYIIIYE